MWLLDMCVLYSMVFRKFDTLEKQYNESRYNIKQNNIESKLEHGDEGQLIQYHNTMVLKMSQRPVQFDENIYGFICENECIMCIHEIIENVECTKVLQFFESYMNNTINPHIIFVINKTSYHIIENMLKVIKRTCNVSCIVIGYSNKYKELLNKYTFMYFKYVVLKEQKLLKNKHMIVIDGYPKYVNTSHITYISVLLSRLHSSKLNKSK